MGLGPGSSESEDRGGSRNPAVNLVAWLKGLREAFGFKLMFCLAIAQGVLKGLCGGGGNAGLVGVPIEFLLKEYHVDASSLQIYKSAVLIPWSIKPLMGLLTDKLPIAGYHRRPYFAIVAAFGVAANVGISMSSGLPLVL